MNQKLSIAMLSAGLPSFLGIATEIFTQHPQYNSWAFFLTPLGVLHAAGLGAAFVLTVIGALGTQVPRQPGTHSDRKTDELVEHEPEKDKP